MRNLTAKLLGVFAVLVGANLFTMTASAQEIRGCGGTAESNVATSPEATIVTSTTFTTFYTGNFAVIASTATDCTILEFSAETACKGAGADDYCYIRAFVNNQEMAPRTGGTHIFASEKQFPGVQSVKFALKGGLLVGENTFRIQVRVAKPGTQFIIDDWALELKHLS